jgi:hypothetical protein
LRVEVLQVGDQIAGELAFRLCRRGSATMLSTIMIAWLVRSSLPTPPGTSSPNTVCSRHTAWVGSRARSW